MPPLGQVLERAENLKIFGSSTLQSGGGDGYLVELRGTNDRTSISMHYSIDWKSRRPVPYYFEAHLFKLCTFGLISSEFKKIFQRIMCFSTALTPQGRPLEANSSNRSHDVFGFASGPPKLGRFAAVFTVLGIPMSYNKLINKGQ